MQVPDGRIGWVREDVIVEEETPKPFQVETEIRYYYFEEDHVFVFSHDYSTTGAMEIQIRLPIISEETQDAAAINAKINEEVTQYIRPIYDQLQKNNLPPSKISEIERLANMSINYEIYQYNDLFVLAVERWYGLAEAGGDYACNVYYYDGKNKKMISAEAYAALAGYTKEEIILAEHNNIEAYYQAETFEEVKFYIKNDGTLYATVDFSD